MQIIIDDLTRTEVQDLLREHLRNMHLHSPSESPRPKRPKAAGDHILDRLG